MAENNSTDVLDLIETEDQVTLTKRRADVIIEAAYEIEQLCIALRHLSKGNNSEYGVRGISRRMQDVSGIIMSAIGDTLCPTDELRLSMGIEELAEA